MVLRLNNSFKNVLIYSQHSSVYLNVRALTDIPIISENVLTSPYKLPFKPYGDFLLHHSEWRYVMYIFKSLIVKSSKDNDFYISLTAKNIRKFTNVLRNLFLKRLYIDDYISLPSEISEISKYLYYYINMPDSLSFSFDESFLKRMDYRLNLIATEFRRLYPEEVSLVLYVDNPTHPEVLSDRLYRFQLDMLVKMYSRILELPTVYGKKVRKFIDSTKYYPDIFNKVFSEMQTEFAQIDWGAYDVTVLTREYLSQMPLRHLCNFLDERRYHTFIYGQSFEHLVYQAIEERGYNYTLKKR